MAEIEISKLVKASDSAANGQVQHVLVMLNPEGTLQLHGALNFVEAIQTNEELNNNLCNTLKNVKTDEVIHAAQLLSYPKLPCSPFSAGWKGSAMIRGVLTKIFARIGYGGGGPRKGSELETLLWVGQKIFPGMIFLGQQGPSYLQHRYQG